MLIRKGGKDFVMFKLSQLSFSNQHVEIAPFLPHHTWYQFSHISRGKKAQKAYFYKSESISKMSSLHSYASLFQSCFFISLCLILVSLFRVYLCFIFKDFFSPVCVFPFVFATSFCSVLSLVLTLVLVSMFVCMTPGHTDTSYEQVRVCLRFGFQACV